MIFPWQFYAMVMAMFIAISWPKPSPKVKWPRWIDLTMSFCAGGFLVMAITAYVVGR